MPDSYLHRDRLGSMIGSFDEQGNLRQHHSYDPFGKPRDGRLRDNFTYNLTSNALSQPIGANILGAETTNRGFTDHEHLDDAQLIHMNGRVYDYNLGRFLSVDPFIQAPGNSQSMNPYSYIMNNPLAGTDPSGYAADIDQDKLEVKVTSQSRTRSAPTGSRIKRDTSRTITATVTDESGKSSNYVYTAARNGSERAFKITPKTLKLDNTDLGSKGQVGVGSSQNSFGSGGCPENLECAGGGAETVDASNGCFDNGESCYARLQSKAKPVPFITDTDIESLIDAQIKRVREAGVGSQSRGAWIVSGEFQDCFFFCFNKEALILSQVIITSGGIMPTPNDGYFGKIDNGIERIDSFLVKITLDISSNRTKLYNPNVASNWKSNVNSALADARASGITRIMIDPRTNTIYRFNTDGRTAIINNKFYEKD
ncbi:MAG: RHS repeat-associated core domain-containing protein [Enterobacterales bacterium]|nr:RHS repeat-associated core domain-containing protein [Enterobacterales bacterium]